MVVKAESSSLLSLMVGSVVVRSGACRLRLVVVVVRVRGDRNRIPLLLGAGDGDDDRASLFHSPRPSVGDSLVLKVVVDDVVLLLRDAVFLKSLRASLRMG